MRRKQDIKSVSLTDEAKMKLNNGREITRKDLIETIKGSKVGDFLAQGRFDDIMLNDIFDDCDDDDVECPEDIYCCYINFEDLKKAIDSGFVKVSDFTLKEKDDIDVIRKRTGR